MQHAQNAHSIVFAIKQREQNPVDSPPVAVDHPARFASQNIAFFGVRMAHWEHVKRSKCAINSV